jgi:stress response protein SCP2
VSYGTSAVSGNITVKGTNTCGNGATSTKAITVNSLPIAAGNIIGTATVCQGQNSVNYGVPTITNATSYIWTLPSGATGTSTTNSITVSYDISAVSGNITVKGTNACGNGLTSTKAITVNMLPTAAGIITGTATVCQGQNSVSYTVPSITNATSYIWTLPSGATGTSTTNSITVSYSPSAVSGNITVKGTNTCGNGATSTKAITVNSLPAVAGIITGTATVCQGQNSVTYSVPAITNATSYIWTLPSGATGTSTTNSITVSYGTSAVSGNITVKGNNTCGVGTSSSFPILVNTKPSTPNITLSGNNLLQSNSINGNQWYDQNGIINGATNQSYTVLANGDYYVIVTLLGCSSDASSNLNVILTGIEATENNKSIKVFPNPVSNELIIESEGNNVRLNFEILNAIGQVIFKGNLVEKTTVQTSDFTPGVYLIKLENGKTFEFKKIIKE